MAADAGQWVDVAKENRYLWGSSGYVEGLRCPCGREVMVQEDGLLDDGEGHAVHECCDCGRQYRVIIHVEVRERHE